MNKLIFIFIALLLVGCATTQQAKYEKSLNIHDVFFTAEKPEGYDCCQKLHNTSFHYGDETCLVVRFGGLKPDEYNIVYWAAMLSVYYNEGCIGHIGPKYFHGDLNTEDAIRDKYMIRVPLVMAHSLQPGLYRFDISILDGMTNESVDASIALSLLPKEI